MLLPILVAMFPAPAMSAEQQLLADIGNGVCSPKGSQHQTDDKNLPSGPHGQCCILCSAQGLGLAPPDQQAVVLLALRRLQEAEQVAARDVAPRDGPLLDTASPRGPPRILPA